MSSVVAAVVSGGGCYKNLPFNNYFLRLPQGGTIGEVRVGGRAVVKLPELTVKVDAIDLGGAMVLILVFAPGSGDYTFEPAKVLVHTADDSVIEPTWYIGPGRLRRLYRDDRGCLPLTTGATRGQEWLGKSAASLPQLAPHGRRTAPSDGRRHLFRGAVSSSNRPTDLGGDPIRRTDAEWVGGVFLNAAPRLSANVWQRT